MPPTDQLPAWPGRLYLWLRDQWWARVLFYILATVITLWLGSRLDPALPG